jgi:hypothetical protein
VSEIAAKPEQSPRLQLEMVRAKSPATLVVHTAYNDEIVYVVHYSST